MQMKYYIIKTAQALKWGELVKNSINEGMLSSSWSIFIATTKNNSNLRKYFKNFTARHFHDMMICESEDSKTENIFCLRYFWRGAASGWDAEF